MVQGKNDRQVKQKDQDKNVNQNIVKDKPASTLNKKKFTCIHKDIDLTTTFSILLDTKMNEVVLNRLRGLDQGKGIVRQVQWPSGASQPAFATESSILAQKLLNPPSGAISS